MGKQGSNLLLSTPTLAAFSSFFKHQTTPLIVPFQTDSDDIKVIVPPIWPFILEGKFSALLETGLHFVNIVEERDSNLPLLTPTLAAFSSFLQIKTNFINRHISNLFR